MISVENVSKSYVTHEGRFPILRNVNLKVRPGEKIGILGRNGAGKSTLIRLISGSERPTGGQITRSMSVSWPLAFTGAFQTTLTGLDNFRCISRIYGVTADDKIDQVEAFAELGRYLREPVRTYSSGMRARLAFAISMAIEFDCFLIDEVVAVGDVRFQEKSNEELFLKRKDRAMIIVSHNAYYVREHCDRAAVLFGGTLHHFEDLDEAYDFYDRSTHGADRKPVAWASAGAAQADDVTPSAEDLERAAAIARKAAQDKIQEAVRRFQVAMRAYGSQMDGYDDLILGAPLTELGADVLSDGKIVASFEELVLAVPRDACGIQLGSRTVQLTRALFDAATPQRFTVLDEAFDGELEAQFEPEMASGRVALVSGPIAENLDKVEPGSLDFSYVSCSVDYEVIKDLLQISFEKVRSGGVIGCSNFTIWSPLEGKPYGVFKGVIEFMVSSGARLKSFAFHPFGYFEILLTRP